MNTKQDTKQDAKQDTKQTATHTPKRTGSAAAGACVPAALALLLTAPCAHGQEYPSRPVRVVVGFAVGGPTDLVARAFADFAARAVKQPFVVDNKPGANTILAAQIVADAPADGYTLLFGATNHTMIPALYSKRVKFDAVDSFEPICSIASSATALVVGPTAAPRSLQEFLDRARKAPGKVTVGTPGVGSSGHFAAEMFSRSASISLNHIPYKGAAPVVTDLMGGQVDSSFATLGSVLPQLRTGKLTALAVASPKRSSFLPDVPTFAEAGGGDFSADAWYGVLAPNGIPPAVASTLERLAKDFATSGDATRKLGELGMETESVCGEAFKSRMRKEVSAYGRIAQDLGIQAE